MATVPGLGTTFNLPNYTGELFSLSPTETPFLSAIGGLGAGKRTNAVEFEWQTEVLEASAATLTQKLEGADAPAGSEVPRANVTNIVEIHQEAVEITYTKQAAFGQLSGINTMSGANPVTDEMTHQMDLKIKKMAIDIELSYLLGTYHKPTDNTTPRATRGLLPAITTNVFTNAALRTLDEDIVSSALEAMFTAGAKLPQDTTVFMVGPPQKRMLTKAYGQAPTLNQPTMTRNVGGVAIDTLVTDFGTFGVMLNRHMPADTIAIVDLSVCAPVFLETENGVLFAEPLAKTGSTKKFQLYCETGLQYGPELYHGVINKLNTPAQAAVDAG